MIKLVFSFVIVTMVPLYFSDDLGGTLFAPTIASVVLIKFVNQLSANYHALGRHLPWCHGTMVHGRFGNGTRLKVIQGALF